LTKVAVLNCDLTGIPIGQFDQSENPKTGQPYYAAYLMCKFVLSGTSMEVEIQWNKRRLCHTTIQDIESAVFSD
jgi:hypothetical protein